MKARWHVVVAAALASTGVFFLSALYFTCLPPSCEVSPSWGTKTFTSVALLSIYLAGVEVIAALHTRKNRIVIPYYSKMVKNIRRISVGSILGGIALASYGMFGLNNTLVSCPFAGCSGSVLWQIYGPYEVSFYLGLCLIVVGALTLLVSKFMGAKTELPQIENRIP